jgi:hypothetical protein
MRPRIIALAVIAASAAIVGGIVFSLPSSSPAPQTTPPDSAAPLRISVVHHTRGVSITNLEKAPIRQCAMEVDSGRERLLAVFANRTDKEPAVVLGSSGLASGTGRPNPILPSQKFDLRWPWFLSPTGEAMSSYIGQQAKGFTVSCLVDGEEVRRSIELRPA